MAYEVWLSIYNDEMKNIYEEERRELRKISMIYCAFQNELSILKTNLDNDISEIKQTLKRKDCLKKCEDFNVLKQTKPFEIGSKINKENEKPERVPFKPVTLDVTENSDFFINSVNSSAFSENPHSPPPSDQNVISCSPVINKPSFSNSKKRSVLSPSLVLYPISVDKIDKNLKFVARNIEEFKTPINIDDSNIMECSIIEDTPNVKPLRKSKLSLSMNKPSKLDHSKTKPISNNRIESKKKKKKREFDSNGPSMSINEVMDLVNETSGSETDAELDVSDETTIDDLDVNLVHNEPLKKKLQSFIENYDKVPEKKEDKQPNFVYHEVVRGKERKKLKGWACQECEKYYKNLNLPAEELEKKKNACSRHRLRFQPREETFPGFWDLSFRPTPET